MEATDPALPSVVICDAGPLIHLDELGCLDLLADFTRVLVPEAVWNEVHKHRPAALTHPDVKLVTVASSASSEPATLAALARVLVLHVGEREALRAALQQRPSLLLTDDTAARLAAGNLGIAAHGTVGVLIRSIRRHRRTANQILEVLRSLPQQSTLHLKQSLLEAVIQEVESSI
jgi:predicted nucleic acid-binding protein